MGISRLQEANKFQESGRIHHEVGINQWHAVQFVSGISKEVSTCMKYGKAKTTPQGTYCSKPINVIKDLIKREKTIQMQALPHSLPKTRHIFFPSKSQTASIIRTIQGSNRLFGLLRVTDIVIKQKIFRGISALLEESKLRPITHWSEWEGWSLVARWFTRSLTNFLDDNDNSNSHLNSHFQLPTPPRGLLGFSDFRLLVAAAFHRDFRSFSDLSQIRKGPKTRKNIAPLWILVNNTLWH